MSQCIYIFTATAARRRHARPGEGARFRRAGADATLFTSLKSFIPQRKDPDESRGAF